MSINSTINIMQWIGGIGFGGAGVAWLFIAWIWYKSFPVPYLWLVWALTAPLWWIGSLIFLAGPLRSRWKLRRLREKGMRIQTNFISSEINFRVRYNYQYPYVIESVGISPKTGEKLVFRSQNLWFNPEPFLTPGQNIDVMLDPDDTRIYAMDLSFLVENASKVLG